jgi:putative exosortase-associated protein (TIGR04073 family)
MLMRNTFPLLAALALVGTLAAGCANQERKLGRGFNNTMEIVRWGEFRRTMESSALDYEPDYAYTTGAIKGTDRTLGRFGLGLYEVLTFPFPNPGHGYDAVCTDTFPPGSAYPDNYKPGLIEDSMFATDSNLGFSGGDLFPMVPGSRFKVFETH